MLIYGIQNKVSILNQTLSTHLYTESFTFLENLNMFLGNKNSSNPDPFWKDMTHEAFKRLKLSIENVFITTTKR